MGAKFETIFLYIKSISISTYIVYPSWFRIIFVGCEGYILYRALIVVFDTGHVRRLLLYSLCYGIPILISFSTLLVGLLTSIHKESQYHKDDYCWLNNEYLFIGFYPVLILMLCFNIFILTVGMRIQMKVRNRKYHMISEKFKFFWIMRVSKTSFEIYSKIGDGC